MIARYFPQLKMAMENCSLMVACTKFTKCWVARSSWLYLQAVWVHNNLLRRQGTMNCLSLHYRTDSIICRCPHILGCPAGACPRMC